MRWGDGVFARWFGSRENEWRLVYILSGESQRLVYVSHDDVSKSFLDVHGYGISSHVIQHDAQNTPNLFR